MTTNTIYELSNFDYLYDSTFYYQFKNDDTVAWRVKAFLREQSRYDSGYFEGDVRGNMELLHLLKGVVTIDGIIGILESSKVNWDLKEKELL